jgi:hypothetical protein
MLGKILAWLRNRHPPPEKLIAYIDESYDDDVFVLAGFVAPVDEWEKFKEAWRSTLAAPPAIPALKTVDAMRLKGCFYQWTAEERDAKLEALYSVIDAHVSFGISAMLPVRHLQMFNDDRLHKSARNPYLHAVPQIIGGVARYQYQNLMEDQIDFVFDERVMDQGKLQDIWDAVVEDAPVDIKTRLGATPVWANDHEELPLQAADLEAWWLRRRWLEKLTGLDRLEYPWMPADITELYGVHTKETLAEVRDRMLKAIDDLQLLAQMMKDPPKF